MILAGDIGGTNARIAFFEVEQRRLKCIYEHVYPTHEHPNLESAVATFIGEYRVKPEAACFGIAGPVSGGRRAQMPNLKWVVEADNLEREIGIESVTLVNDLEANAYGVSALEPSDFSSLNEGRADLSGNQGVIAAGTGLGEAGLYWDGKTHRPFASEGGHVDFGPADELQTEMLVYLRREFGHVSWERVIAGPGLFNVYRFLRDTHAVRNLRGSNKNLRTMTRRYTSRASDSRTRVSYASARSTSSPLCTGQRQAISRSS
jgi:glucokinase